MKIHEYQAKAIIAQYGIPVPRGGVAFVPEEARKIAEELGGTVVVKAQIHAGGRGKGGGIKVVKTPAEAEQAARNLIGMNLVTVQTGAAGRIVSRVLVEEGQQISQELYLSLVIDRSSARPVMMATASGGVEIEKVAKETPELLFKHYIDSQVGLSPFECRKLVFELGLDSGLISKATAILMAMYKAFCVSDASLIEINPFVVTTGGDLLALDAKVTIDDNALFRHPKLHELRDFGEEEALEVEASKHSLNYIRLDGSIGCMVNGAGLAMATMDLIKLAGGEPANFLDVGGGANKDQIKNAFKILMSDSQVRAVLINIFGGILRCDVLADGVISAVRDLNVKVPIVIRMEGTNVARGKEMLAASGLSFSTADTMGEAAQKVVALS